MCGNYVEYSTVNLLSAELAQRVVKVRGERNVIISWSKVPNKPFILMQEFSKLALKNKEVMVV